MNAPSPTDASQLMLREAAQLAGRKMPARDVLAASAKRLQARCELQPLTEAGDATLPIDAHREAIIKALSEQQVVVVAGETGSGKTTQLPRFALAAGLGRRGMIGHTQPRRLAARSVAARIAEQTGMTMGEGVGYAVRFDDKSSPLTLVRLMTDGILLNELQRDPLLLDYEVIIVDEAHERSLNIDFLLGYLATLLGKRPELKVIITSATIDHQRFAAHFDGAPVIEVSGRGYPVTVEYADDLAASEDSRVLARRVCDAVRNLSGRELPKGAGDILVFLPGEREIRDTERSLQKSGLTGGGRWEILPLFGRLSDKHQGEVFRPSSRRRIVLATNVAETSLTVPRIGAVVDTGLARISRYSHRSRIQRLQLEPVSQASANQRAGRCGRIGPGICLRLYGEEDFEARDAYTDPEILRTNLASVVLQLSALNLGEVERFPFLDRPDPAQVTDAHHLLHELGALTDRGCITKLGRQLSRLPLDPRLGRMLLAPVEMTLAPVVVIIVAGLSIQEPRLRPAEHAALADSAHADFADPMSDFMGMYCLWSAAEAERSARGRRAFEQWCEAHFLSARRLREWREVARQLARQLKLRLADARPLKSLGDADHEAIHAALLHGLLSHCGTRENGVDYEGAGRRRFALHPSSALHARPPKWLMALEIVQTHKRFARYAAAIDNDMLIRVGREQLEYEYEAPYWNARRGRVEAKRTTLLYDLIVEAGRRVDFASVNREMAREVFVRQGLVADRVRVRAAFLEHNRREREQVGELAGRLRRPVEISEAGLARLYDQYLPASICDTKTLKKWLGGKRVDDSALHFSREQLLGDGLIDDVAGTPDSIELSGNRLPLSYRFAPDSETDGVSIRLPRALLAAARPADLEGSVPAFLEKRIEARLRALAKPMRKQLHPLAGTARTLAATLIAQPEAGALDARLARVLLREFGLSVPPDVWQQLEEPEYLVPRIEVIDGEGKVVDSGRDAERLRESLIPDPAPARRASTTPQQGNVRDWPFGEMALHRRVRRGDVTLDVYPALRVGENGVRPHDFLDSVEAEDAHDGAMLKLLRLRFAQQAKALRKLLLGEREVQLLWAAYDDAGATMLVDDFVDTALRMAFGETFGDVRDRNAWQSLCEKGAGHLLPSGEQLLLWLLGMLRTHAALRERLAATPEHFAEAAEDAQAQAVKLVFPGCLMATPVDRLGDVSRYLEGAAMRLERVASNPQRDTASMAMIHSLEARLAAFGVAAPGTNQRRAMREFRWHIEELRVSLFAQSLGTRDKVSMKRLEKRWDDILRISD